MSVMFYYFFYTVKAMKIKRVCSKRGSNDLLLVSRTFGPNDD